MAVKKVVRTAKSVAIPKEEKPKRVAQQPAVRTPKDYEIVALRTPKQTRFCSVRAYNRKEAAAAVNEGHTRHKVAEDGPFRIRLEK